MENEIYSNCYSCGNDLFKGQIIIAIHQYYYCSGKCLERDKRAIKLGVEEFLDRRPSKGNRPKGAIYSNGKKIINDFE